jgi:hypothetical protein
MKENFCSALECMLYFIPQKKRVCLFEAQRETENTGG